MSLLYQAVITTMHKLAAQEMQMGCGLDGVGGPLNRYTDTVRHPCPTPI